MPTYIDLQKVKNETWKLYDSWRKTGINSPAFHGKVQVTLLGWRHLIGATGNKKRTSHDTYRRLKLLPYAKQIIEQSRLIQNIKNFDGRTYYALEAMIEVKENNIKEYRKIRVVIIEDYKKNKIFLSIMDKKNRKRKK